MTTRLPAAEVRRIAEIALAEQLKIQRRVSPLCHLNLAFDEAYAEDTRSVMQRLGVPFWFKVFEKAGLLQAPSDKRRRPSMRTDTS